MNCFFRSMPVKRIATGILCSILISGCVPELAPIERSTEVPSAFVGASQFVSETSETSAKIDWKEFFRDPNLVSLIDTALNNNQELKIFLQELEIAKNDASAKSGAYLPFVDLGAGAGLDKVGEYTRNGAVEANNDIRPGHSFPEPLSNFTFGARASWEIDIWQKLRNAEKSAITRVLATQEGRNFLVTNLISEIAASYFELRALDNQLEIIKQNIEIQSNAFEMVKLQKQAARVTELAIRRFEAQVLKTKSMQFEIQQKIFETENKINFLVGRFPQSIPRSSQLFVEVPPELVKAGVPTILLENRPDIRQAELDIAAAELDVKVAKAAFYPSLNITAEIGYEAYRLGNAITSPESLLYNLVGSITGPLINRRAITADYFSANAKQLQAVFNYERTVLRAFIETANQVSNVKNLDANFALRSKQVEALTDSVSIATMLFNSARAEYTEVLLTQRDALESRFELVETKKQQMQAFVSLYRSVGGGWTRHTSPPSP